MDDKDHQSTRKEEEEEDNGNDDDEKGDEEEDITEYEKQRLKTIEKNKAMLAALRLPALASNLVASSSKSVKASRAVAAVGGGGPRRRSERVKSVRSAVYEESGSSEEGDSDSDPEPVGSRKSKLKDQEYEPSDEGGSHSDSEDENHEEEVEKRASHRRDITEWPNDIDMDEEELALQQALALSLGASQEVASSHLTPTKKEKTKNPTKTKSPAAGIQKDNLPLKVAPSRGDPTPKRKKQKQNNNKLQFTTGEVDSLFSIFDESGKGQLTVADIESVAAIHDFTWSKEELQDMIRFFDSNRDGMVIAEQYDLIVYNCLEADSAGGPDFVASYHRFSRFGGDKVDASIAIAKH